MFDKKKSLKMLKEIKSILDVEKISFWLEAGTLLGAIKYGKIMPWDTDIDLGAFKKDFPINIEKKLAKTFENKEFIIYFFPEKIDIIKNGSTPIQIHLMKKIKKNHFTRQMADNRHKSGKILFQIYRLSNVLYYGKFKFSTSYFNLKTNLFKLITYIPKSIKSKISKSVMSKLSKLKNSGVYFIDIPKNYFSSFKKINFYGEYYNVPGNYERYLEQQYGDWRMPPKDKGKPWVWHEHGEWKKVYKKEDMFI